MFEEETARAPGRLQGVTTACRCSLRTTVLCCAPGQGAALILPTAHLGRRQRGLTVPVLLLLPLVLFIAVLFLAILPLLLIVSVLALIVLLILLLIREPLLLLRPALI